MGWMTGFEFHRNPWFINKIQHLARQIAAKTEQEIRESASSRNHHSTSHDCLTDTAASDSEQPHE
jgi:hypothetical protein